MSSPSNNPQDPEETQEEKKQYGVLLYYKYTQIPDLDSLFSFYNSNCTSLSLLGRVRLSSLGVNVTVGGEMSSLESHIEAVKSFGDFFHGTDFKLAPCGSPLDDAVARESGFTSLSIRIVKELVTLSSHPLPRELDVRNSGRHLSAVEFHSALQNAGKAMDEGSKEVVLLDARNLYETRIGKFHTPNVETLDPGIRQYSDLPSWIDDNSEHLRGKSVLMYCTGGIRCEMASAYIKSKGSGFENVFQLFGGIQRYLEQFPDGGYFKGKNFVFDHRISVGSSDPNVLGSCLLCGLPFDDYSSRCRCSHCRMLVLVCDSCRTKGAVYVCELCQKHGKCAGSIPPVGEEESDLQQILPKSISPGPEISSQPELGQGAGPARKLRILCLHGFRQNASSFKGRTASLAKKLKTIAELLFVDAPHELAYIYQPRVCSDALSSPPQQIPPPTDECRRKFAWMIDPDFKGMKENDWKIADGPFNPLQYQQQTEGFETSVTFLKTVFSERGPFDGILGFSQGAAMAASLAARQGRLNGEIGFRFVILCSGFPVQLGDVDHASVNCPSLHIFGSASGNDRQIANQASRDLASLFEDGSSTIIEHDCGHIIPTRTPYIEEIKSFLRRFL
ncbi:Rhodanese-like domain-containing protein 6 [Turnera subulata]|uniref:Rhodanese-like domain-containing protein 6 n=1 Tax=Turnera subulata TaxID=218843 RepID=A0A9Q0J9Q7_9ROSI|nr:Rhodanese-like domain-containing protein 6 [Turnera subulata]